MVEVSRQQLDQATTEARQQQQLALAAQLPRFLVHLRVQAEYLHEKSIEVQLENAGKIARRVVMSLDQPEGPTDVLRVELLRQEQHVATTVRLPKDSVLQGRIRCLDEMGIDRETTFQVIWDARGTMNTQPDPFVQAGG
ncbi:hypothetical protein PFX98_19170 [Paucibacter sediminis]|uniref:Uncharacterized protein n=1 Tax=Paucibacter sediminis TaxID=3019553 RepID=A0AA95NEX2_9BURK|nr:hypothetical protein [Paucibacter sp. S2-9]WIT11009.1 hypothetical protein PFX98_19170 [Paucibacter sp. S2-9]